MMDFQKIVEGLETAPLKVFLKNHPDLWKIHTIRQSFKGTAHSDTETIYLRGPKEFTREVYQETDDPIDYPVHPQLLEALDYFLPNVLQYLCNERIGYLMLVKLKAGGVVQPHIDEGLYSDSYDRFHIPIQTKQGNDFYCGMSCQHMKEGELWFFDHKKTHSFMNNTNTDRIHLIIDSS